MASSAPDDRPRSNSTMDASKLDKRSAATLNYDYSLEPRAICSAEIYYIQPGGFFSDLTLVCEGRKFPVYRVLMCTASSVIRRALEGQFKDTDSPKEADTHALEVTELSVKAVLSMIHWIYYGTYDSILQDCLEIDNNIRKDPDAVQSHKNRDRLLAYLELNRLADYYDIYRLKDKTREDIFTFLGRKWSTTMFYAKDILMQVDEYVTDEKIYAYFVKRTAAHLKSHIWALSNTDGSLPPKFLRDVLNVHFGVTTFKMNMREAPTQ
ncbi:hypothetical protein KEM56_007228 [Ascosphaera pollenicola]|nr:hypothetical protein KEM56_007228 [Ascosphaera pollenicola]